MAASDINSRDFMTNIGRVVLMVASAAAWPLFGNQAFYWKGAPVTIPVCWENAGVTTPQRLTWIREAMERQWMRYARVNFAEWDGCKSGDPGVHVRLRDTVPSAPGGATLNAKPSGAILNVEWNLAGPAGCRAGEAGRRHCTQSVSLHEFGHVLGFYHEEERADYIEPPGTPPKAPCDKQDPYPNAAPRYYGAYDVSSIMSYCGQPGGDAATWRDSLSPGDIASVQRVYGRRIAGTLISPRSTCLASHAERPNGEVAFMWRCDEARDDQEWSWDGVMQLSIQTASGGPRRCLQASPTAGVTASIADCSGAPGQRWSFEDVAIRGWGALCLDVPGGATSTGTVLQVWQCGALGGKNQRWSLVNGQLRYGSATSSVCLTAPGTNAGGPAGLQQCATGVAGQLFDLTNAGEIRSRGNRDLCLDVRAARDEEYRAGKGLPANGASVQFYGCLPAQLNQKWNVSGALRLAASNLCLARDGDGADLGAPVRLAGCAKTEAQMWDYYPRR